MKIQDIIQFLENYAHPSLQESYDNAGLLTGDKNAVCSGVLVTLDTTPEIVEEAVRKNCNLIVSHHPILFKGLKKINGSNYVERTIIAAIKHDIAIYAIHTNLDNVLNGVNSVLATLLGLENCKVLAEKEGTLMKLVTFAPAAAAEQVRNALFEAGAGAIGNYSECSFNVAGTGTFKALEGSHPFVGEVNQRHGEEEVRIEVVFSGYQKNQMIANLKNAHPYEEVAYYLHSLENTLSGVGSGLYGELAQPMEETAFLELVKEKLKTPILKHTSLRNKAVKTVAVCGGSGFFLLPVAKAVKADVYITSDIKYHEFFDADGAIVLVDAGHYETEQFTIELLATILQNNFPNFAVQKTERQTNPVHYFL